jgi:hypothetical protein
MPKVKNDDRKVFHVETDLTPEQVTKIVEDSVLASKDLIEDGMIGDGDNGIPKIEVDPATGDPIGVKPAEEDDSPKYDALAAVQAALNAKPTEFEDQINGLLADKLQAAVEKRREEIARSIFNGEVTPFEPEDTNAQEGTEEATSESKPTGEVTPEPQAELEDEDKIKETTSEE